MPTALMMLLLPQMTAIVMVLILMDNYHLFLNRRFFIRSGNRRPSSPA